jgi:hypothetical protein
MHKNLIFAWIFCFACAGYCQAPNRNAAPAPQPTPAIHEEKPVAFHSDLLDLSFAYPASLTAKPLPTPDEQHAATAKTQPADEKDEYRKADQCTDAVLAASRDDDPKKGKVSIAIYGDQRGTVLSVDRSVKASILMSRMGIECMTAELQGRADEMAGVMAESTIEQAKQDRNLHSIDRPIWYESGKARIHFAAAESSPTSDALSSSKAKLESQFVAALAFVWKKNLVSIVLESNDLPFMNEMLHGVISLGTQAPAPLFPADLGSGTPIHPKP